MYHHRKTGLQLILIIACAFGCSVATLSGTFAAASLGVPAAALLSS